MLYSTVICLLFHKEAVSGTLCHFFLHCNVALIFMLCESGFLTLLGGRKVCPHFRNSGSLFQFVSGGGGGLALAGISWVSVTARCPQGESFRTSLKLLIDRL